MARKPLNKRWTDADDAILREMVAARKSAVAIGARLGRNAQGVRIRARQLGLNFENENDRRRRMGLSKAEASTT